LKNLLFKILGSGVKPVNGYHATKYIVKLLYIYKWSSLPGAEDPSEIENPFVSYQNTCITPGFTGYHSLSAFLCKPMLGFAIPSIDPYCS